ncbi:MAG: hypothetical protein HOE69_08235 [Euryarchaeota archaeon]|nr:hypothetical protein [Euryarchaeota archaeon]
MSWPWKSVDWNDPKGGTIRFFPYIPTTVMPRSLRPRDDWDGVALLLHEEERDGWADEEKMEAQGKGSATMLAIHGGGDLSRMLIRMQYIDEINAAKFPDPEPRRLVNLAKKGSLPTYFVEPGVDDEEWLAWMEACADEASRLPRMFMQLFARRRFAKTWKKTQPEVTEPSINESGDALALAAGLAATWWRVTESFSTDELREQRNTRLTSRLRGALAHLVESKDDAVLIVPIFQDWMKDILASLKTNKEVEEVGPVA